MINLHDPTLGIMLDDVCIEINDITNITFKPTVSTVVIDRGDKPQITIDPINVVVYNILAYIAQAEDLNYTVEDPKGDIVNVSVNNEEA